MATRRIRSHGVALLAALAILVSACAPQAAPTRSSAVQPRVESRAPKVLTISVLRELSTFVEGIGGMATISGADKIPAIAHDGLVVEDERGAWVSQLAAEPISPQRGTWTVNPDGTMTTTWKLRPNVKWHDGSPFTAEDLVFTYNVFKDPEIPERDGLAMQLMTAVSAPDPQTFVVSWSAPYVNADRAPNLIPLPRHLLEDAFQNDRAAFLNSPRFSSEFVGLGPYRLVRMEPGSHLEFARFDDYYRGRPPLDTVFVRVGGDPNTMIANIVSGAVDVLLPVGVDIPAAVEVKRRWEGSGNLVIFPPRGNVRHLELQQRLEYAEPRNGLTQRAVRQALYHGTDRQTLIDVVTEGVASVADSWLPPNLELRAQVERDIPQFPYDLARAQQLMQQAGWVRGADGALVHQSSGERFEIMLFASQISSAEKEQNIIADGWKGIGAQVTFYIIPTALAGDLEHRSKLPGAGLNGMTYDGYFSGRLYLHSKYISGPANRWTGANRMGYQNLQVDAILDRLVVTIDPAERTTLHRILLQEGMGDVGFMPLYWNVDPVLALKRVKGIQPEARSSTWNIFDWTVD